MALKTRKMWSKWHWNSYFSKKLQTFSNNTYSLRRLGAPSPDTCLWYVWVTLVSSLRLHNLTHVLKTLTFGSSLPTLTTFCLRTIPGPLLLIFPSKVFLSQKSPSVRNLWWRYITCDLRIWPSPIKNSGYAYARIKTILRLVIFFSTNQRTMLFSSRRQDIFEDL